MHESFDKTLFLRCVEGTTVVVCFHCTKVTLGRVVVFWFLPNLRNTKPKRSFTFYPSQQSWVVIIIQTIRGAQVLSCSSSFTPKYVWYTLLMKSVIFGLFFTVVKFPQIQQNASGLFKHSRDKIFSLLLLHSLCSH